MSPPLVPRKILIIHMLGKMHFRPSRHVLVSMVYDQNFYGGRGGGWGGGSSERCLKWGGGGN